MRNLIKARVLWIEDFDEKKADTELMQRFIKHSGLTKSEIDWAIDFDDFLSKINSNNMIYDTIIIDVNVPAESENYDKIKEYITEKVFMDYIDTDNMDREVKLTGCIVALFLLRSKLFDQNRICFYSANIYKQSNDLDSPDDMIYGIENHLRSKEQIYDWYSFISTKIISMGSYNTKKDPKERRNAKRNAKPFKSWV